MSPSAAQTSRPGQDHGEAWVLDLPRTRSLLDERIAVLPREPGSPPHPHNAHRVGILRRIATARLRLARLEELIAPAGLVVSELLTNALRHSGTQEIRLVLGIRDGFLCVVVIDGMSGAAKPRTSVDEDAECGRGLLIVDATAQEHGGTWGTTHDGAQTWCRFALPGTHRSTPPSHRTTTTTRSNP
ncbi:ATP-binding protein [Streptomyces sp. NPDC004610]|uniref:ATP-binding protein n=1 Tax=unclassified Streptomyces TaxID=2593676 RepID=UPI0033B93FCA